MFKFYTMDFNTFSYEVHSVLGGIFLTFYSGPRKLRPRCHSSFPPAESRRIERGKTIIKKTAVFQFKITSFSAVSLRLPACWHQPRTLYSTPCPCILFNS